MCRRHDCGQNILLIAMKIETRFLSIFIATTFEGKDFLTRQTSTIEYFQKNNYYIHFEGGAHLET